MRLFSFLFYDVVVPSIVESINHLKEKHRKAYWAVVLLFLLGITLSIGHTVSLLLNARSN